MDNNTARLLAINTTSVFPLDYRITATVLHGIIFLFGVVGNVLVVIVVHRKKSMHIPTYCYLVSLAIADVLVILVAMPEAIISYHLYSSQWLLGQAGCSLMTFLSFLGINASSLSILAFTVERFIAICHPLRAKSICTLQRAKKIIIGLWILAFFSACPWLGLTVTRPFRGYEICTFRVAKDKYVYLFGSDLLLFYGIPLVTSCILYFKIGLALRKSSRSDSVYAKSTRRHNGLARSTPSMRLRNGSATEFGMMEKKESIVEGAEASATGTGSKKTEPSLRQSRIKVIRMLLVIVILFAVLWLPYRGISLYNGFVEKPLYNKWLMLFAKTCIFLNSSINPILYNAMSKRFRQAFRDILFGDRVERSSVSTNSTTAAETLSSRSPLIRAATPSPSLSNSKEVYEPDHNHSVQSTTALQVVFTNSKDFLSPGRSVMFLDPTTGNDKDNGSLQCPRPSHLP